MDIGLLYTAQKESGRGCRIIKQGYIFWSKLKNREEFEGGLHEKKEGENKIKEKSDKNTRLNIFM